jgi:hypothetical protein
MVAAMPATWGGTTVHTERAMGVRGEARTVLCCLVFASAAITQFATSHNADKRRGR